MKFYETYPIYTRTDGMKDYLRSKKMQHTMNISRL